MRNLALAILLALCAAVLSAFSQDAVETIRVETRLVSVPVIASDRNGRYIPNLAQSDFTVYHDGAVQPIEFFAATEEPISVALLIDTSQSTRPVLGDIKDSAKGFLKLLRGQDRATIASFDYDLHVLSPMTADQEQLKKAVNGAKIPDRTFGTVLRDAAYETIVSTFAPIKGRKALIILTDGKDAGSRISQGELLRRLEESDTLVYTIMFKTDERPFMNRPDIGRRRGGGIFGGRYPGGGGFPPPNRPQNQRRKERVAEANLEAEEFLQELSKMTAGRFFSSKNGKLKETFASIVDELRFQYRLGFYPPVESDGKAYHDLKIKIARPDSVVRARSGYRVPTP